MKFRFLMGLAPKVFYSELVLVALIGLNRAFKRQNFGQTNVIVS